MGHGDWRLIQNGKSKAVYGMTAVPVEGGKPDAAEREPDSEGAASGAAEPTGPADAADAVVPAPRTPSAPSPEPEPEPEPEPATGAEPKSKSKSPSGSEAPSSPEPAAGA
ncbi:hypothetical protein ACWGDE_35295, partial [Streptomyces sp. NPDC054956]